MGMLPLPTLALEQGVPNTITKKHVNEANGKDIATAQVSKSQRGRLGYENVSFSDIQSYPDKAVQGERNLSHTEASFTNPQTIVSVCSVEYCRKIIAEWRHENENRTNLWLCTGVQP